LLSEFLPDSKTPVFQHLYTIQYDPEWIPTTTRPRRPRSLTSIFAELATKSYKNTPIIITMTANSNIWEQP
jgi:hypothetical protein